MEEQTGSLKNITSQKAPFSSQPKPLALKIPEMGKHFLSQQDREYLITTVDTIVSSISTEAGIKNLLRGILPDAEINRINYRSGSRNIAEEMVGRLEPRGALNSSSHALGAFCIARIEDGSLSYDTRITIVTRLFAYTLVTDRNQIAKLSAQFQVPSPLLSEERLMSHPFSSPSLSVRIPTTNLQERLESLYNRRRYLLDVTFLSQGAKAASAVCRIDFDKRGEGTGFLVAPDLILTNYHVMIPPGYRGDPDVRARKCEIKFGVIEEESAGIRYTLHDQWLVAKSVPEDLDFMLLRLNQPIAVNDQIKPLALEPHHIQLDEFVNIIQHPNGGAMEVSLRFNQVVAIEGQRIYYLADTEEGSSGSPVFDDSWRLVALHHSGGELDGHGNLTRAANVGIPITAIREKIAPFI